MVTIASIDHLVLTVTDLERTRNFYTNVLGMMAEPFLPDDGTPRWSLKFGHQKINLHQLGSEFKPNAVNARVGSADLCFLSDEPLDVWIAHFTDLNIPIELGPINRTGATGPIVSLYIRDPDGNLLEISNAA